MTIQSRSFNGKNLLPFALGLLLCISGCTDMGDGFVKKAPEVGEPSVDFLFADINGVNFQPSKEKGKVNLLFFWRMKCKECTSSMDSLDSLNNLFKDKGLNVAAINVDSMHSSTIYNIRDFIKEKNYGLRVLRDAEGFVAEAYRVIWAPKAFIIDKKGIIRAIKDGEINWMSEENMRFFEKLVNEPS